MAILPLHLGAMSIKDIVCAELLARFGLKTELIHKENVMREYEAMIVTKSDLPESEMSKIIAKIEGIFATDGGQVIRKDVWGVRKLAYPIRKLTKGSYVVYDVATHQKNIIELERVLKLDENVMRSMVIKLADTVNVEQRKIELQKELEAAALKAAENARERADSDSFGARRGGFRDEE